MSGDLTVNKIMGAVLATGLVIMGVKIGSEMIYDTHAPAKPGYLIEVAEVEEAGGGAAVDSPPDWGTVLPAADVAAGEAVFKKCSSCHTDTQGGPDMTGPNLFAIVGRNTASHGSFAYSDAMVAHKAEAPSWTYDQLYGFLGGPPKWVKGTKMTFAGVKKPEDRINLIAYLRTMGSTGYAIPAPDPSRAPGAAAGAAAPAAEGGAAPTATPQPEAPTAAAPAPAAPAH
jgi:cytochrome c